MIDILVLCDDYWHPAEVIRRGFGCLKTDKFRFDFVMDAKDVLSVEMLKSFKAIACCKGDQLNASNQGVWFQDDVTEVGVKELKDYVTSGGGYISLHSSNTAKKDSAYGKFVGNYFLGHPKRCNIDIQITGDHPIVKGIKDFSIRDEHYQLDCFAEDTVELFKSRSEAGGIQTGGYAREYGGGRLCMLAPGHILSVWEHPSFQQLLLNVLCWCTKQL
jgi:type 1 glutamine amidotransferase